MSSSQQIKCIQIEQYITAQSIPAPKSAGKVDSHPSTFWSMALGFRSIVNPEEDLLYFEKPLIISPKA